MSEGARIRREAKKVAAGLLADLEARLEQAKADAPAVLAELERRDDTPPTILEHPVTLPWTGNATLSHHIGETLTEERVRRIAEEVAAKVQARLDARIAALEALNASARQPAPPRETGWAVAYDDEDGLNIFVHGGPGNETFRAFFIHDNVFPPFVLWLDTRDDAETLARLLGIGRAALLYRDTLEEVEG